MSDALVDATVKCLSHLTEDTAYEYAPIADYINTLLREMQAGHKQIKDLTLKGMKRGIADLVFTAREFERRVK